MSIKEKSVQLIILFLLCTVSTYSVMAESLYDVGYKAGKASAESQCDITSNDAKIRNECDVTSNDAKIRNECDVTSNDAKIRNECDVTSNDTTIRNECDITSNDPAIRDAGYRAGMAFAESRCDITSNDPAIRNECDITSNDAVIRDTAYNEGRAFAKSQCNITSNDAAIRDAAYKEGYNKGEAFGKSQCDVTSNDVAIRDAGYKEGYSKGEAFGKSQCDDITSNDVAIRDAAYEEGKAFAESQCDDITSNDVAIRDAAYEEGKAFAESQCDDITSNDAAIRDECDINSIEECKKCSLVMRDGSFIAPVVVVGDDLVRIPVELSLDSVVRESRGFHTLKVDKIAGEESPNPDAKSILVIVSIKDKLEDIFTENTSSMIEANDLTRTSPYHWRILAPIQVESQVESNEINKLSLNTNELSLNTINEVEWFGSTCTNQQDSTDNPVQPSSFVSTECTIQFDQDYQVVVVKDTGVVQWD